MTIDLIIGVVIICISRLLLRYVHDRVSPGPAIAHLHPPGPKGLPWLGNMFQIPYNSAWEVYREWSKQFGKVYHIGLTWLTVPPTIRV